MALAQWKRQAERWPKSDALHSVDLALDALEDGGSATTYVLAGLGDALERAEEVLVEDLRDALRAHRAMRARAIVLNADAEEAWREASYAENQLYELLHGQVDAELLRRTLGVA